MNTATAARFASADFTARVAAFLPRAMASGIDPAPITATARARLGKVENGIADTVNACGGRTRSSDKSAHHFEGAVVNGLQMEVSVQGRYANPFLEKLDKHENMFTMRIHAIGTGSSIDYTVVRLIYWCL